MDSRTLTGISALIARNATSQDPCAPPAGPHTSLSERDGCAIATLRGELDVAAAPALREELLALLRRGNSRLIIDLSAVAHADASGIAVLVGSRRRAELLGGWLRLAGPTAEVTEVLSVTGLNRHLATFPTVRAAIAGPPDTGKASTGTREFQRVTRIRPVPAPARHPAGSSVALYAISAVLIRPWSAAASRIRWRGST